MKKRSFLSILLVFVMIAAVCLFVGCDEEETNAKIDNAVVEAVTQATEKIETAKTALETAIATKADAATLTAKVDELNAAITAAKDAAVAADATLKAEIEAAITTATKAVADAAAANLETAKTELTTAIATKADAATLTAKVEELNAAIETAKTAATTADVTLKGEIEATIKAVADTAAANLETAKTELNAAIATKADAAEVTTKIADLVAQIATAKQAAIDTAATAAAGADATLKADIEATIAALKKELADADTAITSAYIAIDKWNEATEKVIDMLIDLELAYRQTIANSGDLDVEAELLTIYTDTSVRLYRAYDIAAATKAYEFATKIFDGVIVLEGAFDGYDKDHYYDEQWDEMVDLWDEAFADLMAVEYTDEVDIDAISKDLVDGLAAVETKAELLMAELTAEGNTVADVIKNDTWSDILSSVALGLSVETDELKADWDDLAAVVELYDALAARYEALVAAYIEADRINGLVDTLTADLNAMTIIKVQYKNDYTAIKDAIATWTVTYFTGFETEGDVNYAVLDAEAVAALDALYEEKVGKYVEKAYAADAAIDAIATVTIRSEADIKAAYDAYLDFTNLLATLEFNFAEFDVRTTEKMLQDLAVAEAKFTAICAAAIEAYAELADIDTTTVTIYSEADVTAIIEWYETYLGVDATAEDSVIGMDVLTITDGTTELTLTEADLVAVKALIAAHAELVAAKIAETNAVIDMIDALVAKLSMREAADNALAARNAWLAGDNAPEGYTAAQFAITDGDVTYVISNYDELVSIRDTITALEATYADICAKIAALTKVEDDLVDATERGNYVDYVALVEAEISAFITSNADEDPFTAEQYAVIETAKVEIAQGAAIQNVTELRYDPISDTVALIADERVSKDIIARADAALEVAVAEIKTIISTDAADFVVPTEALQLIEWTAECYVTYFVDGATDNFYTAYKALRDRVSAGSFEEEKGFIEDTFKKVVA